MNYFERQRVLQAIPDPNLITVQLQPSLGTRLVKVIRPEGFLIISNGRGSLQVTVARGLRRTDVVAKPWTPLNVSANFSGQFRLKDNISLCRNKNDRKLLVSWINGFTQHTTEKVSKIRQ